MAIICPECQRNDRIEKISAIIKNSSIIGTYAGPTATVTYSQGNYGTASSFSGGITSSSSVLAQILRPDPEPRRPDYPSSVVIGIGLALIGCAIFFIFTTTTVTFFLRKETQYIFCLPFAIGGCMLIGLGAILASSSHQAYLRQEAEFPHTWEIWRKKQDSWERQYYCYRDDIVFDPETGKVWKFTS